MADSTKIEWTDKTWSPWEGCTKVSDGCTNCYAEGMNRWLRKGANWGPGAPRRLTADWTKPLLWNRQAAKAGVRYRVFPSICDPFDNEVPAEWRSRFYELCNATPHLTWLLLTKRIGNVKSMAYDGPFATLPNVWLGATVVNQEEADRDVPKLLAVPARVRFLSVEPMLGPVDLRLTRSAPLWAGDGPGAVCASSDRLGLHWVIAGSESGPHARRDPAMLDWIRSLRDQCSAAGVAFHWKQDAERGRKISTPELDGRRWAEFPA